MNQTNPAYKIVPANSVKMLKAMVTIGTICALLIVLTYEGTLPRIERLKAEALEKAIFKVLPDINKTETYHLDQNNNFNLINDESPQESLVYAGFNKSNELMSVAVEASGQGYAGVIRILYGYDPEKQKIIGFYVLESKETPGLGDKIEKDSDFLANFISLDASLSDDHISLNNAIIPVKHGTKKNDWEIDGITGATISSRAIGNIIGTSSNIWVPLIYNNKESFNNKKLKSE